MHGTALDRQPVRLYLGREDLERPGYYACDLELLMEPGIPDRFADEIWVEGCVERMSGEDVAQLLRTWHRILRPGGLLRIAVPQAGASLQVIHAPADGGEQARPGCTCDSLAGLLRDAGFVNCRQLRLPYSTDRTECGLILEARRPRATDRPVTSVVRAPRRSVRLKVGLLQIGGRAGYGLDCLAACLERDLAGRVEVQVYADAEEAIQERPRIVGMGCVSARFGEAKRVAAGLKREIQPLVVVGGHHITALPECLTEDMDLAVLGEGEGAFKEIVELCLDGPATLEGLLGVRGIAFRAEGRLVRTAPRPPIADLDSLPFPRRSPKSDDPAEAALFTGRGCRFGCMFCSSRTHWGRRRVHSADYVLGELEHVAERFPGVERIHILDDLFVVPRGRLMALAEGVARHPRLSRLRFCGSVRPDLLDEDVVRCLRMMGFERVRFDAVTGSDRLLRRVLSGPVSVARIQGAIELAERYGLTCGASFMVGIPGETRQDLEATLEFIRRNEGRLAVEGFYLFVPLPGTPVWEEALARGKVGLDMDWKRLDASFASPEFDWDNFVYLNDDRIPRAEFADWVRTLSWVAPVRPGGGA